MRIQIFLVFLIPFMGYSQSFSIKNWKSYGLKGKVQSYTKQYLVQTNRVRGSVKIDTLDIERYVDIPKIHELIFNKEGYVLSDKGTRYVANGGDWERNYTYSKIGDTLMYRKESTDRGSNTTYNYEYHFENGNMIYESVNKKSNFKTPRPWRREIRTFVYDAEKRLLEKKQLTIERNDKGEIDSITNTHKSTYVNGKLWKWQDYYQGRKGYTYYLPYEGCQRYFTETDSVFSTEGVLERATNTLIAHNVKVYHKLNFKQNNASKEVSVYDELGRKVSYTRFYYSNVRDSNSSSEVNTIYEYYDDVDRLKSTIMYDVDSKTHIRGDILSSQSYDRAGRTISYTGSRYNRATWSYDIHVNTNYTYFRNDEGYVIKIIKNSTVDKVVEDPEITTYEYDAMNNLIHEKTVTESGKTLVEIAYNIVYFKD